jgi:HEPN domain-containing protein
MQDRKHVQEWLTRGDHDWQSAQLLFKAKAPTGSLVLLLQQACEKELKGYLVHKGWLLKKTHNLAELVDEAIEYDAAFDTYLNLAHQLTAYYFETRYPPGAPKEYSEEEIDNLMRQAGKLITTIKESLGGSSQA